MMMAVSDQAGKEVGHKEKGLPVQRSRARLFSTHGVLRCQMVKRTASSK